MKRQGETGGNTTLNHLLAFLLDGQRYALRLSAVERLVRMVEVVPLPKAPEIVIGLINLQGRIVPVLNVRKRFALQEQPPEWNDYLLIAHTSRRTVSFAVDSVIGVFERTDGEIVPAERIVRGISYVAGVAKLGDGILFIHDLDRFLSLDEEADLDAAMAKNE